MLLESQKLLMFEMTINGFPLDVLNVNALGIIVQQDLMWMPKLNNNSNQAKAPKGRIGFQLKGKTKVQPHAISVNLHHPTLKYKSVLKIRKMLAHSKLHSYQKA